MNQPSTIPATVGSLPVPGALLHHEVRGQGPLVVLVGAPMDARSFEPLACLLAEDHTVLTTDPRGINRSPLDDPDQDSTPELRAGDLARLLTHLDAGPAVVLGSSGGAVSALALVQSRPELVRAVIAHEPPLLALLDDRERLLAGTDDIVATHRSGDVTGAWKKFLAQANIFLPEGAFEQMFGGPREPQDIADDHFQHAHMLRGTVSWDADLAALRAASPRVLIGLGEQSRGQLCERTSVALAARLGVEPTLFPGGHIGFAETPGEFDTRLRAVLAAL
ncbi:alpha/beta fold hydrolase [Amycolatopsis sp. H20-H5]|uniref:alpha/beta fold hydrolase n=1 Tax=Amycolatopsis sp. H20-H5 TaxID=3046309 RepID=UPI002DB6AC6A|nr:alpha/beta hydrolase [Amycolatopsis sp. H20-H5]MEC3981458.1 alpha/beta hydrolase [Amycolatopsis sp. H20-H5]